MANDLIFEGEEHSVTLPSGNTIIIRDTNGEDDARLSLVSSMADGSNIRNFLSNIIVNEDKPTMPNDLLNWPLSDIYYLLFKQRLFNQGTELTWEFKCKDPTCEIKPATNFEYDLTTFDKEIGKYPNGLKPIMELTTSRKKTVRYKILTGELEKKLLAEPPGNSNRNTPIVSRELELFKENQWQLVTYFGGFSSKEMVEIHNHIKANDYEFSPKVDFTCPHCKTPYIHELFGMPTFYWPRD